MARLILSVIDNDPLAQVILFHDSRQGPGRIAAHAACPEPVASHGAGHLSESRLRAVNAAERLRKEHAPWRAIRFVPCRTPTASGYPDLPCFPHPGFPIQAHEIHAPATAPLSGATACTPPPVPPDF